MASASSSYECPVCHEDYDNPKILPCGHLVCRKCVLSWVDKEGSQASCPLCRASILSPDSVGSADPISEVNDLPTDLHTAALVESQQILQGPQVCSLCENDVAATSYCIQCAIKLCSNCVKGHKKIPITKTHSVENLDDLSVQKLAETRHVMCKTHPDKLAELYCPAHQEVICILCGTTSHGGCADRKTIADMVTDTKAELEGRVQKLRLKETELADEVKTAKNHFKAMRNKVQDTFDDLQKDLDAQRQKFSADIEAEEKSCMKSLSMLENTRAALTQNTTSVGQLVQSASGGALLQMLKTLRARLDDLEKRAEAARTKDAGSADFVLDSKKLNCLKKDMAELGYVGKPRPEPAEIKDAVVSMPLKYKASEPYGNKCVDISPSSACDTAISQYEVVQETCSVEAPDTDTAVGNRVIPFLDMSVQSMATASQQEPQKGNTRSSTAFGKKKPAKKGGISISQPACLNERPTVHEAGLGSWFVSSRKQHQQQDQ